MASRTVPGIDEELRAGLVVGLNQTLASLTDLASRWLGDGREPRGGD